LKILKIIFPLFLISFFFISNVSASTTTYNSKVLYDDSIVSSVDTYSTKISNLHTYLSNVNCLYNDILGRICINDSNWVILLNPTEFSTILGQYIYLK